MLEYTHGDGKTRLEASGSVIELTTDVLILIGRVYEALAKSPVREAFRRAMQAGCRDDSPVWEETDEPSTGVYIDIDALREQLQEETGTEE